MGQYYKIVNLDKKEYLNPHAFGDGLKLLEFGMSGSGTMTALAVLLVNSNNRGGGDLRSDRKIVGSWASDRIVICGDYAKKKDRGERMNIKKNLYDRIKTDEYKDISKEVITALCDDRCCKDDLIDRGAVERMPEITTHNNKEYLTVGIFKSERSGEIYKVKESYNLLLEQKELTCNCKGWIFNKKCKHITYICEHGKNLNVDDLVQI